MDISLNAHFLGCLPRRFVIRKLCQQQFNQTDRSHPAVKNTAANFDAFIARYPQYIHLPIHVADIVIWLRKNSMLPELDNIITAWKALARDGKLKINGSATGLDRTEIAPSVAIVIYTNND